MCPRALPDPRAPSLDIVRKHNLTHWPYAPWCPHCVMARRTSDPHFQSRDEGERQQPLFVVDYCFIRNAADEELITLLVGKLYPFRKVFCCVVDSKGTDPHAVTRLVEFLRDAGVHKFTYKCDQESSLNAMMDVATREMNIQRYMDEAIRRSGRAGTFVPLTDPENSAVGSSASNGRAERTVRGASETNQFGKGPGGITHWCTRARSARSLVKHIGQPPRGKSVTERDRISA